MNTITITGNLTRDIEVRYTASGTPVGHAAIAHNYKVKDEDKVFFLDLTLWGEMAEVAANQLHKGDRVVVSGRLQQETWTKDGKEHNKWLIVVDAIGPDLRFAPRARTTEYVDGEEPF